MTNKQNKALLLAAVIAVPVLSIAALLLRVVALFTVFDGKEYFFSASQLPSAFVILTLASLLVFLLFAIFARKVLAPGNVERTELSLYFSSAFLTLSLAVLAFLSVLSAIGTQTPLMPLFHAALAVLAVFSAVYFLLFLKNVTVAATAPRAYLALAPALFSLTAAILLYFDRSTQMNTPAKLLALATFIALAFVFLVECRAYAIGALPARRYLSLAIGFYFSITASLPNLVYTLVRGDELMLSSAYDFALFAFALYFLARLIEMLPVKEKSVHPLVRELKEEADVLSDEEDEAEADADADEDEVEDAPLEQAPTEPAAEEAPVKKPRTKKAKAEETAPSEAE